MLAPGFELFLADPAAGQELLASLQVGACELEAGLAALERGDVGSQVGDPGVDVFDGVLELEPAGADQADDAVDLGLGGRQVGFGRRDRGLLDRELDLVRFLVELDQDASLLHPHVVVDEHLRSPGRQPAAPRTSRGR